MNNETENPALKSWKLEKSVHPAYTGLAPSYMIRSERGVVLSVIAGSDSEEVGRLAAAAPDMLTVINRLYDALRAATNPAYPRRTGDAARALTSARKLMLDIERRES